MNEAVERIPYRTVIGANVFFDPCTERAIRYRCPTCKRITTEIWPRTRGSLLAVNNEELTDCTCDDCENDRCNRIRRHCGIAAKN